MHLRMPSRTSHRWVCQIHSRKPRNPRNPESSLVSRPSARLPVIPSPLSPIPALFNPQFLTHEPLSNESSSCAIAGPLLASCTAHGLMGKSLVLRFLCHGDSHIQPTDAMLPHRSVSFALHARPPLTSLPSSSILSFLNRHVAKFAQRPLHCHLLFLPPLPYTSCRTIWPRPSSFCLQLQLLHGGDKTWGMTCSGDAWYKWRLTLPRQADLIAPWDRSFTLDRSVD